MFEASRCESGATPPSLQNTEKRIRWRPREQAIASAAGTPSRRLQYPSKNRVDFSGLPRTAVERWSVGNYCRLKALAPELARHQQVDDRPKFAFESRRLQTSLIVSAKSVRRSSAGAKADPTPGSELRLASHEPSRRCQAKVGRLSLSNQSPRRVPPGSGACRAASSRGDAAARG
jgi:hypothetical protein